MKTEQILLALETSKYGSISKAAQNLFIAQPNASSSISALENEIGYKIFERTYNGVSVTKEGEEFLRYAQSFQRIMKQIYALGGEDVKLQLFIAAYSYSFADKAFLRFCSGYSDTKSQQIFELKHIGTIKEGMNLLEQTRADIAVVTCREELYGQLECEFDRKGLMVETLGNMSLQIVMSKKHPLAESNTINLDEFLDYPLLTNAGLAGNYAPSIIAEFLKKCRIHIIVEPGKTRFDLFANDRSFAICTPYQWKELETHELISKTIPNTKRRLLALIRTESQADLQVKHYMKLLREEVEIWMGTI